MKTKFILQPHNDIEFLNSAFPEVEFSLYQAKVHKEDTNAFLSVFACWINNEEMLEQLWSRINSLIGAEYQVNLQDDFSSWNIYLVFFMPQKLSNRLKYTIENETFFVRKLVVDGKLKQPDPLKIATYLNNHILGEDIIPEQQPDQATANELQYSAMTQNLLTAKLALGRTAADKTSREVWLNNAILGIKDNEI